MITIVDLGMGNMNSIQSMLSRSGHKSEITGDLDKIKNAKKLILPGVGSYDSAMRSIRSSGLFDILIKKAIDIPILGICLGMQLLFEGSEEGVESGLGLVEGKFQKFSEYYENDGITCARKVPHMGWGWVRVEGSSKLLLDVSEGARFYFVHSYYLAKSSSSLQTKVIAKYGFEFICGFEKENIFGFQFHPEKSHQHGIKLLSNFAEV